MTTAIEVLIHAFTITVFVFVMMLIIEYLNVLTRGSLEKLLTRWTWGQSLLCAGLGAVPGCLGAFAVTSLYMHRVITAGAATAAMIATSGDEAFVMLALFPRQALLMFGIMMVTGATVGVLTDLVFRSRRTRPNIHLQAYRSTHDENEACVPFSQQALFDQWKQCTAHRGWLTFILIAFISAVITGHAGHKHLASIARTDPAEEAAMPLQDHADHEAAAEPHDPHEHLHESHADHAEDEAAHDHGAGEWNWVRITLLLLGMTALGIVLIAPDHFLDEHIWNHLVRVHVWRILLWTTGALLITHLLVAHLPVARLVAEHRLPILLLACLIGIVPESGPHLIFVTLFAQGAIPFSTLLASSIVQDGHGMIPMLAHSRRAFFGIKTINFTIGLAIGIIGWLTGW